MSSKISYKDVGVDVKAAEKTKERFASIIDGQAPNLLSNLGTFAAAIQVDFSPYKEPVLVFKMEEPGSKQVLAIENGSVESLCYDLINHLVNDIAVMGAKPVSVQDCIVCGELDPKLAEELVAGFSAACKLNDCVLSGGETSVQPGVLQSGKIILSASVVGVVEKSKILDGRNVKRGDLVFALPSNGPHTNGYTLIRKLLSSTPNLAERECGGESFLKAALKPHTPYGRALVDGNNKDLLTSSAHITGSGIAGNLKRVIKSDVSAEINLNDIQIPEIFKIIKEVSKEDDEGMLETFNMGVGATVTVRPDNVESMISHFKAYNITPYQIGVVTDRQDGPIVFRGNLNW